MGFSIELSLANKATGRHRCQSLFQDESVYLNSCVSFRGKNAVVFELALSFFLSLSLNNNNNESDG